PRSWRGRGQEDAGHRRQAERRGVVLGQVIGGEAGIVVLLEQPEAALVELVERHFPLVEMVEDSHVHRSSNRWRHQALRRRYVRIQHRTVLEGARISSATRIGRRVARRRRTWLRSRRYRLMRRSLGSRPMPGPIIRKGRVTRWCTRYLVVASGLLLAVAGGPDAGTAFDAGESFVKGTRIF